MHALETMHRLNKAVDLQPGLRAKVSDDTDGSWFSGEVISVTDDPAGNVTVKLRPDMLSRHGRLPIYPQEDGCDWSLLLYLWLVAHGLLLLMRVVLG